MNFPLDYVTVIEMDKDKIRIPTMDGDNRVLELWARKVDDLASAVIRGCGVEEPLGIIHAPAAILVTHEYDGCICYSDLEMMSTYFCSLRPGWIMSPTTAEHMKLIKDADGYDVFRQYGLASLLLGWPAIITDACPRLGQCGDVILVSLSKYIIGRYDQDGVCLYDGAPMVCSVTWLEDHQCSPFVVLDSQSHRGARPVKRSFIKALLECRRWVT